MIGTRSQMEQVFAAIPSALTALRQDDRVDQAIVFAAWSRCAGEMLGSKTFPIQFLTNRLVVGVRDEMWRRNLEGLAPQMLVNMNAVLGPGNVRFIEFRIDRKFAAAGNAGDSARAQTSDAGADLSVVRASESIVNEDLRVHFLEAAAACLARNERETQLKSIDVGL